MLYISLMYISRLMIFLLMTSLAVYFIFILDYRNDVRQKANSSNFLNSNSKCVVKQWRQLATSTHLAQELLTNIQCSGGSRSFAKEMKVLKMRIAVAGHWKLTLTNWEQSLKLILLQLHEKLLKNSTLIIQYGHLASEANWKGEKTWKVGALWADWK